MKIRLLNLWESLRTSFWFIPAAMTLSAVVLSFLLVFIDKRIDSNSQHIFGFIYSGGADGARLVLSTIAGSMITVAGVTFSITIVALTLASSQFGPRLLRNFMHDTGNQVVLGTFIASFAYCLLVLRTIRTMEGEVFVPNISVAIAIVLALAGIAVLIYFIHHVSVSMQAEQVISAVYRDLEEKMQRLFPEESQDGVARREDGEAMRHIADSDYQRGVDVLAAYSGYLQAIDYNRLLEIAGEKDLLVILPRRPGDFIVAGIPLMAIKSKEETDENTLRQLANTVIVGSQRTPEQDAEFAVHQLVEVALRALSPGINDPYTAISCIDRLGSALCFLCDKEFPSTYRYDEEGNLRVVSKPVTFKGIIDAAFDQVRQYGGQSISVTIRLLETLGTIALQTRTGEQREAVFHQAGMILSTSREFPHEENDIADVRQRYEAILDILGK
jgi:uncharacterized membrane protein